MAKVFRYPRQEVLESNSDYIKIDAYEYEPPGLDVENFNFVIPTSDTNYQTLSRKISKGTVILPVPQSVPTNSQSASWTAGTMNPLVAAGIGVAQETIEEGPGALSSGVQGFISKVASSSQTGLGQKTIQSFFATQAVQQLLGNDQNLFGDVLARNTGAVINENVELLFRGVNLRAPFQLGFDVAPRSKDESNEVKNMIIFLKKQMSPKKGTQSGAAGGLFLTAPSVFKIQYMSGGKPHPYLNKFKICALTDLSVNFTGSNTYATYSDGTPVHMNLTLQFQELTPIYAEDYPEANETGVGY